MIANRGELPAEIRRIGEPQGQALTAKRRVNMRRIAGEQHSAFAVGVG
jgi:hypothetical protein